MWRLGSSDSEQENVLGFCLHRNEISGFIKRTKFYFFSKDQYQLFTQHFFYYQLILRHVSA